MMPASRTRMNIPEPLELRLLMSTYTVDDSGGADFTSIQAAVTASHAGDTIKVLPGTYNENVNIPADKDDLTIRSDRRWAAVVKGTGGAGLDDAVFKVDGADDVEIRGFTITGPSAGLEYGVLVTANGSAEIRENHVTAIRSQPLNGVQVGVGIGVLSGEGDIRMNVVDDYQKAGIVIDGASSTADVTQNLVTGVGSTNQIAQNGIQVSNGATANVRQNVVSKNIYAPGTVAASGILLSSAGAGTVVSQNEVFKNDVNIAVDFTSGATIERNDVRNATFEGITLFMSTNNRISQNDAENNGENGISLFDGSDNNVVEKNESSRNGRDGISVGNSDNNRISQNKAENNGGDGIYMEPTSEQNRITQNSLKNNARFDAEDESVGTGTAGTANIWEKNKGETENRPGLLENGKGKKNDGKGHGHGKHHGNSEWERDDDDHDHDGSDD